MLADTRVKELDTWLSQQEFDPRLQIRFRGANEEQAESFAFINVAFSLSLILMFVLLVTQFNSFYQSGLILFAVVMSTAGVLLGVASGAGHPICDCQSDCTEFATCHTDYSDDGIWIATTCLRSVD